MGGVATLFSASFGGYILMLVKDSSSHLSLYEELRNLQADTVGELKDWTKRNLCSKTTLIASSVSGAGVNPPFCKMGIFFLRSLALSISIYRNFQSNGGKWRSLKLWIIFFSYNRVLHNFFI